MKLGWINSGRMTPEANSSGMMVSTKARGASRIWVASEIRNVLPISAAQLVASMPRMGSCERM